MICPSFWYRNSWQNDVPQRLGWVVPQDTPYCLNDAPVAVSRLYKHAGVCVRDIDAFSQHLHRDKHMNWFLQTSCKLIHHTLPLFPLRHAVNVPSGQAQFLQYHLKSLGFSHGVAIGKHTSETSSLLQQQVHQAHVCMMCCHSRDCDVIITQDSIFNGLAHGVLKIDPLFLFQRGGKLKQLLSLWQFGWQGMVSFIHQNRIELQLLQEMNRPSDGYEPICIKVNLLIVTGTHFAEARKVYCKLVQQSTQRHYDQDLATLLMKLVSHQCSNKYRIHEALMMMMMMMMMVMLVTRRRRRMMLEESKWWCTDLIIKKDRSHTCPNPLKSANVSTVQHKQAPQIQLVAKPSLAYTSTKEPFRRHCPPTPS